MRSRSACLALLFALAPLSSSACGGCGSEVPGPEGEPWARFAVGVVPHFDVRLLALLAHGTDDHQDFVSVDGKPPRCDVMDFEPGPVLALKDGELHTSRNGGFVGVCGGKEYEFEAVTVNHVEMVSRPIDGTSYDTQRRVMETPTGFLLDAARPEERLELTLRPYDALGHKVIADGRHGRVWSLAPGCDDVVSVLDPQTRPLSTSQLGLAPRAPGTCLITASWFGKVITKTVTVRCSEAGPACPTTTTH